jgi:chromosome segregation ATPase
MTGDTQLAADLSALAEQVERATERLSLLGRRSSDLHGTFVAAREQVGRRSEELARARADAEERTERIVRLRTRLGDLDGRLAAFRRRLSDLTGLVGGG